jgi:hypothetical protein
VVVHSYIERVSGFSNVLLATYVTLYKIYHVGRVTAQVLAARDKCVTCLVTGHMRDSICRESGACVTVFSVCIWQ